MNDLKNTALSSSAQLGSLEDSQPVKRLTAAHLRKLRAQAIQQEGLRWSFMRLSIKLWQDFVDQVAILVGHKHDTYCEKNGHTLYWRRGTYQCRYCGRQSSPAEAFVPRR